MEVTVGNRTMCNACWSHNVPVMVEQMAYHGIFPLYNWYVFLQRNNRFFSNALANGLPSSATYGKQIAFSVRNFQERAAINAPIQGSASELMRMAMINIFEKIKAKKINDCKLLLQIHDELIFEVKKSNIESVKKSVESEMKSVQKSDFHSFSIPILVDVNIGENWGLLQ